MMVVGAGKMCSVLKGNDAARVAAKKGLSSLLSNLFKR